MTTTNRIEPAEPQDVIDGVIVDWARERPELDVAPIVVFARMGRVRALAEQAIEAVLSEFDLTLANFDVLASLRRAGKPYQRTPTELASSTLLTSGGMTFRLDRVEDAGLVERVPSSEDRRVTYARLTPEGLRVVEAAMTAHIANEERLLAGLTAEERRTLSQLLRKLELSIQRTSQDGEHPS